MSRSATMRVQMVNSWPAYVADVLIYHGWDHTMLADRAGVDPSMIGRWLSGRTQPTIDSVRGVCRAAGTDIREGLIAAGMFTEDELSYQPNGEPDLSKASDEALLAETRKRMKRHLREQPGVEVHETVEQDGREIRTTILHEVNPQVRCSSGE